MDLSEMDLFGSGWRPVEGFCEHGNESSDFIVKFLIG
jgi:hypothetical protein